MEGASEWVEGGLISFGPPQTPKSKKPRGVPRQPRKTSTPISEKGQGRTSSTQMSPPLTSPEGEGHGEGETGLLGSGVMGPVIAEGMPPGVSPCTNDSDVYSISATTGTTWIWPGGSS